jgi:DNA repair exonuclease SbcCD nuclease subunit
MAKVLVIGDPHFRIDNVEEVDLFIQKITDLENKTNPDFVVCLGDLLHTHERLHTIPLNKAYEFVRRMSRLKLYLLVGNHDYIQNQQFLTENHWMNALKKWENVVIVDKVLNETINGCNFTFCPYVPNGRFAEALQTIGDTWKMSTCIFAHQEFRGCKMGAIISVDGDSWDDSYPRVISGHIHSKQRPQRNIYYTGSALQHAFGESDENTVSVVDFLPGKEYKVSEIDLGLPRKKIVYSDISDPNLLSKAGEQVKLTLSGDDQSEFKAFKKTETYKNIVASGAKVVFKVTKPLFVSEPNASEYLNFGKLLYDSVSDKPELLEVYNLIVNNEETIILEL